MTMVWLGLAALGTLRIIVAIGFRWRLGRWRLRKVLWRGRGFGWGILLTFLLLYRRMSTRWCGVRIGRRGLGIVVLFLLIIAVLRKLVVGMRRLGRNLVVRLLMSRFRFVWVGLFLLWIILKLKKRGVVMGLFGVGLLLRVILMKLLVMLLFVFGIQSALRLNLL